MFKYVGLLDSPSFVGQTNHELPKPEGTGQRVVIEAYKR